MIWSMKNLVATGQMSKALFDGGDSFDFRDADMKQHEGNLAPTTDLESLTTTDATAHAEGRLTRRETSIYFARNAGGFDLMGCPDAEGNARRIVACWNACEGVSTEWLEAEKQIVLLGSPIADRFRELERELNALLAHCPDAECYECGRIICPHGEPLHFHHDGCPACATDSMSGQDGRKTR